MRRQILSLIAVIGIYLSSTPAWAVDFSQGVTLSGKTFDAIGIPIKAAGFSTAAFQVCCGAFVGTVSFLASIDGFNFEPLGCWPITGNPTTDVPVTSATAHGIWRCDIRAIRTAIRADLSGYGAGTVTVTVIQETK